MRPEREFLLEQATACRQLALISNAEQSARLRKLADEYDTVAQAPSDHPRKGNPVKRRGTEHDLEKWDRAATH